MKTIVAVALAVISSSDALIGNIGLDHSGFTVPNVEEASNFLMEVFDCRMDWQIRRAPTPTSGERGWDELFFVHSESHMPHVAMLQCGDHHLAQYIELFEWSTPIQRTFEDEKGKWMPFSDIGHGYFAFTVKNITSAMEEIKNTTYYQNNEIRFIQDPPMSFPLRHEMCTSTFLISPWGQWIELSEWSISGPEATVIKRSLETSGECSVQPDKLKRKLDSVLTPAWFIDLPTVEFNINLFLSRAKDVLWRPPVKAHKSPKFAQYLQTKGAKGILTLKVSEAEVFAANGIKDIYVANIIVQKEMIVRLVRLAGRIDKITVHVDHEDNVREISEVAKQAGLSIGLLVELNIGHNRTGVDTTADAVALTKLISDINKEDKSISFEGITGYEGHTPVLEPEKKTRETNRCHAVLKDAKDAIEAELDIPVSLVSGGGSSNYVDALNTGVLTEIQAGGVAFIDKLYNTSAGLGAKGHKIGTFLLTTVVSASKDGSRAMADAGFKATGWHPFAGLPVLLHDSWEVAGLSAEHLKLKPKEGVERTQLKVGDRLTLIPGYTDAMGLNHKMIFGVRDGIIEEEFPVLASGMLH